MRENTKDVQTCTFRQVDVFTLLNEQTVLDALRKVIDPEIGCNFVDLGLIYGTTITTTKVTVQMIARITQS